MKVELLVLTLATFELTPVEFDLALGRGLLWLVLYDETEDFLERA